MGFQELLRCLELHRDSFPEGLVAEMIARRDEAVPLLLEILEEVDRDPRPRVDDQERMDHVYALYLLALFPETRAYPLLVRIFSRADEFAFDLAGDVVTQDLSRILASVSGGDLSGMKTLAENERANEWVRSAAIQGMLSLMDAGQRTREEVMSYFLELFSRLERKPGAHWDGLATACAELWPQEALDALRQAYQGGLVDPQVLDWQDIEDALAMGKEGVATWRRWRSPLIDDVAEAMSWMQCFQKPNEEDEIEEQEIDFEEETLAASPSEYEVATVRRTTLKTGRNEPCPCGSGKKFKKCCARP